MSAAVLNLTIKTVSNDVYRMAISADSSAGSLKARIRDATSVAVERQRLIYRGRVLQDDTILRDYNIEDGHTVHLVVRPENFQPSPVSAPPSAAQLPRAAASVQQAAGQQARVNPSPGAQLALLAGEDANTMEHIRQSLLTMHTLMSTTETTELRRGCGHLHENLHHSDGDRSSNDMQIDDAYLERLHTPSSSNMNAATSAPGRSSSSSSTPAEEAETGARRKFFVGQWIDVKDTVAQWLEATVMEINEQERLMFVHYNGWPERWDEWIAFDSPRVAPFRSRTVHSTLSPYVSPTPNVTLARAPVTGANDLRTLLPEVARMFRTLQPAIEAAAALAEESLHNRPTVSAYSSSGSGAIPAAPSSAPRAPEGRQGAYRRPSASGAEARSAPAAGAGPGGSHPGPPSARIAPGMPWEGVGRQDLASSSRRRQAQAAAYARNGPFMSGPAGSPSSADASPHSPTDRRQRQRYWHHGSVQSSAPQSFQGPHAGWEASASGLTPRGEDMTEPEGSSKSTGPTRKRPADAWGEEDDARSSPRWRGDAEEPGPVHKISGESAAGDRKEETPAERAERAAATDARLRSLAQELCPIIDRFGRVLADLGPHMWELGDLDSSLGGPPAPEQTSGGLEGSLFSMLRNRPPSPQPRRAYRTPIALQTRIGAVNSGVSGLAGFSFLPGMGLLRQATPAVNTNNVMASILSDLVVLSGGAPAPPAPSAPAGTAEAGAARVRLPSDSSVGSQGRAGGPVAGGVADARQQVGLRFTIVQPTASTNIGNVFAAQQLSAATSNAILQAQLAENIRARTELLSSQTEELNSYSEAIEEMLRGLTEAEQQRGSGPGPTLGVMPPAGASHPGRSAAGSAQAAAGAAASAGSPSWRAPASGRANRQFASAIAPGPLHSLQQTAPAAPSANSSAAAAEHSGAQSRSPVSMDEDSQSDGEDGVDGEDEGVNEEVEEPLNDLLPTLSFNELGQSLMDLRSLHRQAPSRSDAAAEEEQAMIEDEAAGSGASNAHSSRADVANEASQGAGEPGTDAAASDEAGSNGSARNRASGQGGSMFQRLRRSLSFLP